jgi:hypothetical protein
VNRRQLLESGAVLAGIRKGEAVIQKPINRLEATGNITTIPGHNQEWYLYKGERPLTGLVVGNDEINESKLDKSKFERFVQKRRIIIDIVHNSIKFSYITNVYILGTPKSTNNIHILHNGLAAGISGGELTRGYDIIKYYDNINPQIGNVGVIIPDPRSREALTIGADLRVIMGDDISGYEELYRIITEAALKSFNIKNSRTKSIVAQSIAGVRILSTNYPNPPINIILIDPVFPVRQPGNPLLEVTSTDLGYRFASSSTIGYIPAVDNISDSGNNLSVKIGQDNYRRDVGMPISVTLDQEGKNILPPFDTNYELLDNTNIGSTIHKLTSLDNTAMLLHKGLMLEQNKDYKGKISFVLGVFSTLSMVEQILSPKEKNELVEPLTRLTFKSIFEFQNDIRVVQIQHKIQTYFRNIYPNASIKVVLAPLGHNVGQWFGIKQSHIQDLFR